MTNSAAAPRSRAFHIFTNAMSGVGARLAMMVIGFSLTPFIIHSLGLQNYGLWAVVGSLAGYLGLLDFGLGGAFVKFITEYAEQGRKDRARQVLTFGAVFYAVFGLLLAVPVYLFAPAIVHLFKMPPSEAANAANLFRSLFLLLVASMVLGLPGSMVVAMQRLDLASRNNFTGYLIYAATTVILLRLGWGVWGIVASQAAQTVVTSTLQYMTARRLFGPIWHHSARLDGIVIRRMFGFGGWTQLNSILSIVSLDVGRFISASIVSVASVSYYEMGSKLSFFSRSIPAYLLDAIMPVAAAADARRDDAALERLYRRGTLYAMFATLAIAGFLIGAGGPIVHVWMGEEYPFVSSIIVWLGCGYAVSGATGVGATILRACGMPRYETYLTGISAIVNLVCTLALAPRFGIVGVAVGTGIGWIAGTVYFLATYHRIRPSPWWPTVGAQTVRMALAAIVATSVLAYLVRLPFPVELFANRFSGLVGIAAGGVLYVGIFSTLAWFFGAFQSERTRIIEFTARLKAGMSARLRRSADPRVA